MRHGRKHNHLGRTHSHRIALLSNMAGSLILYKKIETTVPKAKELRKYIEPLVTKSKTDTTHSRRLAFNFLREKEPVKELFGVVAEKVGDRPGGYTRILKTGRRLGDNAEMCIIELVDFNELYTTKKEKAKSKTRRSRKKATDGVSISPTQVATDTIEEATIVEDVIETPIIDDVASEVAIVEEAVVIEESTPVVVAEDEVKIEEDEVPTIESNADDVVASNEDNTGSDDDNAVSNEDENKQETV